MLQNTRVEAKVLKRCQYIDEYGKRCNRGLKTGWKYCYEHRHSNPSPGGSVINKATNDYIRFHTIGSFVIPCIIFIILLIPFLMVGFFINQCLTVGLIGIVVSIILSLYISIKYVKVRFMPELDVRNKKPDYVNWVQKKVNKAKEESEFRKNLWR